MPIFDHDGTTMYEIGRIADHNGTEQHTIGKVYDHDGTTMHLIYSAEETLLTNATFGTWYLYSGETGSKDSTTFDLSGHDSVQVTGNFKIVMSWSLDTGMYSVVGARLILADGTAVAIDSYGVTLYSAGSSNGKNFDKTLNLSSYSAEQLKSCKIRGYMNSVYQHNGGTDKRMEGTVKVTLVKGL